MLDKYQLIDSVVMQINELMDAHGIHKAVIGVEAVQKLKALCEGLRDEDKARKEELDELRAQLHADVVPFTDLGGGPCEQD